VCAPEATYIEMEVIHWLRAVIGFRVQASYANVREIGGCMTVGGTMANAIGLLAAREFAFPGSLNSGVQNSTKVRVLIPEVIGHYSCRAAMAWLSMGQDNVVSVPVDDNLRMIPEEIETAIIRERRAGNVVIACVVYAGDSRAMSVDDFGAISSILKRHNDGR